MIIDIGQISGTHPILSELLVWLEDSTGLTFTITSQQRHGKGGIHDTAPTRAHDLRIRDRSIAQAIQEHINSNWQYDPNRPYMKCAKAHGVGYNFHLHIQVHSNTKHT